MRRGNKFILCYFKVATASLILCTASASDSSDAAVEIRIQLGAPKPEPATVETYELFNNQLQKSSESLIRLVPSDLPK